MNRGELAVWAWSRPGLRNFGDELGPAILSRLGYTVRRVPLVQADLIACGSVLEQAASAARAGTVIWGSGLQLGRPCDVSRLDVRAVRGRLTATALGLPDVVLGDPGILVPQMWKRPPTRRRVGVVPHYIDTRPYPWADLRIDVTAPVDEVIEAIGSCAAIASSSLHGLIVAQAWGIPAVRLHHNAVVGGDFKWADWLTGHAEHDHDPQALLEALP